MKLNDNISLVGEVSGADSIDSLKDKLEICEHENAC